MQYIDETLADLAKARERLDSIVVSYSGGKDSLVVMDLCLRTFKHVDAFFMEFAPGLSMSDQVVEDAKKRWGVTVRRYLHWSAINAIADSVYCDGWKKQIKKASLTDIYTQVRRDTGLETIATGAKRADGIWRRRVMASSKSTGDVLWPIAGWQKAHILAYLHTRKIPVPDSEGSNANGIDLSVPSLLWLHDRYPDDFRRLLAIFPYAQSVVERRRFFPDTIAAAKRPKGKGSKADEGGEAPRA